MHHSSNKNVCITKEMRREELHALTRAASSDRTVPFDEDLEYGEAAAFDVAERRPASGYKVEVGTVGAGTSEESLILRSLSTRISLWAPDRIGSSGSGRQAPGIRPPGLPGGGGGPSPRWRLPNGAIPDDVTPPSAHMRTRCTLRSFMRPYMLTKSVLRKQNAETAPKPKSDSSMKFFRFMP